MQITKPFFSITAGSVLVAALSAAGCSKPVRPPAPASATSAPAPDPRYIPVVRYGRYTLVELAPASAQQDLMTQVIDIKIPNTRTATVGDALRHVLARSGYRLCTSTGITALTSLPLPAAHYRLGPILLRDALLALAGPAWALQVDDRSRHVCFVPASAPSPVHAPSRDIAHTASQSNAGKSRAGVTAVEKSPLPGHSLP